MRRPAPARRRPPPPLLLGLAILLGLVWLRPSAWPTTPILRERDGAAPRGGDGLPWTDRWGDDATADDGPHPATLEGAADGRTSTESSTDETVADGDNDDDDVAAGVAALLARHPAECAGKAELLRILLRAAGPGGATDAISAADCVRLPTWREVTALYGPDPVVVGLDSCARYQDPISAAAVDGGARAPRVAGLFNTGTNALAQTLDLNLGAPEGGGGNRTGSTDYKRWNMPGGKHVPAGLKYARGRPGKYDLADLPLLLPVVLVRDPLRWMRSMCGNPYTVDWLRGREGRCPNLVPTDAERATVATLRDMDTFEVVVWSNTTERYRSLADMWTEWNLEYAAADVPRLLVRFEDLLFHAEWVTRAIADCAGLPLRGPFRHLSQWAKTKAPTGTAELVAAFARYGRADGRYDGLLPGDVAYAARALDPQLLRVFHYPPVARAPEAGPPSAVAALEAVPLPAPRDVRREVAATVDALRGCSGKEELVAILLRAGLDDITEEHCAQLPAWSEVTALYGAEPVVFGLETCARYRAALAPERNNGTALEPTPRVAGLFNTGTNALAQTFNLNFQPLEDYKLYNVPSRKHVPARDRWLYDRRFADDFTTAELRRALPVVLVRDPFRWMRSMCRAPYNAEWDTGVDGRCPNLVPTEEERRRLGVNTSTFQLTLRVREVYREHYESLATLWSEWNRLYLDTFRPRLMVRFEDTLFHPEMVMRLVQNCVGSSSTEPLKYFLDATKRRRDPTGFVTALAKYGRADGRYDGLTQEEARYLQSALDPELMAIFGYPQIRVPSVTDEEVWGR